MDDLQALATVLDIAERCYESDRDATDLIEMANTVKAQAHRKVLEGKRLESRAASILVKFTKCKASQ